MKNSRNHIKNLFINWGGHAVSLVVMFFLSPYVVSKLDAFSYGAWSLLTVLLGYMGIFDIGVRSSVGRHVALYLGKKDYKGIDETIRSGFAIFTLTGGIILLVGVLLGWLFPIFFQGVSLELRSTVKLLLPFMALNIWLAAVATIFSSVLTAHDRFDIARSIDLGTLFVRTGSTVFALHVGWGLWGLAGSMVLGNLFALIANRLFAGKIFRGLRSFPLLFSRMRMKELFGYGFYAFISSITEKIIGQSDLVIVGALLSVAAVREYSIGAMLVFYSAPFLSLIGNTFFPVVQRKVSCGFMEEVRRLLYGQIRISFCFGLLVYIGLVFYSQPFIKLWMLQDDFGQEDVVKAASVMAILALSKLPSLYIAPCLSVLAAMGHIRFNSARAVCEAILNVILSLIFVIFLKWDLAGVAAGTLVARLLVGTVSVPFFLCRKADISVRSFFVAAIFRGIVAAIFCSLSCYAMKLLWPPDTWFSFSINVLTIVLIWCLIALVLLVPQEFRQKWYGGVRGRIAKICFSR
jgi:O-antigen/teichoic acid export membrane protein